jgi:hypothetical protein
MPLGQDLPRDRVDDPIELRLVERGIERELQQV